MELTRPPSGWRSWVRDAANDWDGSGPRPNLVERLPNGGCPPDVWMDRVVSPAFVGYRRPLVDQGSGFGWGWSDGCPIARWHLEPSAEPAIRTTSPRWSTLLPERPSPGIATGAQPSPVSRSPCRRLPSMPLCVMVPTDRHEAAAVAVLNAGRHLLLRKPMAPTLEALRSDPCGGPEGRDRSSWSRRTPSTGPRSVIG